MERRNNVIEFKKQVKRGDIWFARLIGEGSMQQGNRPVIVISNDKANYYSPNITIIPLTTSKTKRLLPTHVVLEPDSVNGLLQQSISLAESETTITKDMLIGYIGKLDNETIKKINRTILIQNGLEELIEM